LKDKRVEIQNKEIKRKIKELKSKIKRKIKEKNCLPFPHSNFEWN
jgi:hypoxanthine-guanine phosphoribosyltransferase